MEAEITSQLRELKRALDAEHASALAQVTREYTRAINLLRADHAKDMQALKADITQLKKQSQHDLNVIRADLDSIRTSKSSAAPVNNQQLAIRQQAEMSVAITNKVKKDVLAIIEQKVMPQIQKVAEYVQYTTQDTDGLMNDYRMAAMTQDSDSDALMITDGKGKHTPKPKNKYGPWTSTVFGDDDY